MRRKTSDYINDSFSGTVQLKNWLQNCPLVSVFDIVVQKTGPLTLCRIIV